MTLAEGHGYLVPDEYVIRETYSGATLERPGLTRARQLVREKSVEAVVCYEPSRLSRDAVDLMVLLREFGRSGAEVLMVRNEPVDDPVGRAMTFLHGTFAEVERREIRERTMRGKERTALEGQYPAGFGRHSPYGTRWDKQTKKLEWLSEHHRATVRHILDEARSGKSMNRMTRDLNDAGIPATVSSFWHRSAVHRVVSHARLYAGTAIWKGIEIPEVLERPVSTMQEAEELEHRSIRNKQRSHGFGKRRWLSGRVFGECGHVYRLEEQAGARCRGRNTLFPEDKRCNDPRMALRGLEKRVLDALVETVGNPDLLRASVLGARAAWEVRFHAVAEQRQSIQNQLEELNRRRRQLSVQHEYGALTDDELRRRLLGIRQEQHDTERSLKNLDGDNLHPPTDARELISGPDNREPGRRSVREESWEIDLDLLQEQVNEIRLGAVLDAAILGASARTDSEASGQLDELAEVFGLRVTIGFDRGLTVQFGVPLTAPMGSPDAEVPEAQMVTRPSSSAEQPPQPSLASVDRPTAS